MSLRKDILYFDGGLTTYSNYQGGTKKVHIDFAMCLADLASDINQGIREYIADIENGECKEVLGLDFKNMTKREYWQRGNNHTPLDNISLADLGLEYKVDGRHILTTADIAEMINNGIEEMVILLKEAQKKTMNAPKALFGRFFRKMEERYDEELVSAEYLEWIHNTDKLIFDSLKAKQTLVVAEFLKKKILRYASEPTQKELGEVKADLVKVYLPINYDLPSEFESQCAKFRRFISWQDDIMQIDYNALGWYLFRYYYKLSEEERNAIFQLDLLMKRIHSDMAQLHPELAAFLKKNSGDTGGKNYFACGKNLGVMLEGDWFLKFRTDKKYDRDWIIKFVSALMKSEYRDVIADEWSKPERRLMLKASIVGCLKEAGVIEGSDLSIAKEIINGTDRENKTFAAYIAKGKKCAFFEWIIEYIKN